MLVAHMLFKIWPAKRPASSETRSHDHALNRKSMFWKILDGWSMVNAYATQIGMDLSREVALESSAVSWRRSLGS